MLYSGPHAKAKAGVAVVLALACVFCMSLWVGSSSPDSPSRAMWFWDTLPSPSPPSPPPLSPLKDAAPAGFHLGAAHNDLRVFDLSEQDIATYEAKLAAHFNIVTPENACKPATIMPEESNATWNFEPCDRVLAFAEAHGLRVRLHTLAWGEWNPGWMVSLPIVRRPEALRRYMQVVLGRYHGRSSISYIDVVNEAVCDNIALTPSKHNCDPSFGYLKRGQWYPAVNAYLDDAFRWAREYAPPGAKLVYNDYGGESTLDPSDPGKADRIFETVRSALERGVPIDAVGFQFHIADMHGGHDIAGMALYSRWIEGVHENFVRFAGLGVEIHVTEIDVGCNFPTVACVRGIGYSQSQHEHNQADVFARILDTCLRFPECTTYQSWGWTDRFSWRNEDTRVPGIFIGDQTSLIFDSDYAPKPAAYAIEEKLRAYSNRR